MFDIKQHLSYFTEGKWDDFRASLAKDVMYVEIATKQEVKGPDAYIALLQRWKKAFPDVKAEVRETYAAGNNVIVELAWKGTHSGPFEGPFGTIPPTSKFGTLPAVLIYTMRDDKLVAVKHYFDLLTLLSQMGIAPVTAAPQAGKQPVAPVRH